MQKIVSSWTDIKPGIGHSKWWVIIIGLLLLLVSFAIGIGVNQIGVFTLLVTLGLFVLIATLANPDIGLFIYIFTIYINLSSLLIEAYNFPSIAKALVALMTALIFMRSLLFRDRYRGWVLFVVLLGLYAFLGTISAVFAADYELAQSTLIEYLKDALLGIIVVLLIQRPSSLRCAIWSILAAGILMGSISVFQQLTGTYNNEYWGLASVKLTTTGERLSGPIGDPNFYAQIMALVTPLAIWAVWTEKKLLLKGLAAWAFFVSVMTVIFTFSRGGFLAMILAFMIMAFFRPPRLPAVLLGSMTIIILFQFIPLNYQDRITSLLNILPNSRTGGYVDESVQGRASENLVALNIFFDHPILGVGVGNYNIYYQEYSRKLGLDPRLQDRSAHNLYLEVAAERGLLGLLVFGSIIVLTLRKVFQSETIFKRLGNNVMADLAIAVGVSLIIYLISSIFLHDAYARYFWLFIAISWSVGQSSEYLLRLKKSKGILI